MARLRKLLKIATQSGRLLNRATRLIGHSNRAAKSAAKAAGKTVSNRRVPALKPKAPAVKKPAATRTVTNNRAPAAQPRTPASNNNRPIGSDFRVDLGRPAQQPARTNRPVGSDFSVGPSRPPAANRTQQPNRTPNNSNKEIKQDYIAYKDNPSLTPGQNRKAREAYDDQQYALRHPNSAAGRSYRQEAEKAKAETAKKQPPQGNLGDFIKKEYHKWLQRR